MPSVFGQLQHQMKMTSDQVHDREELRDWCLFFQGELLFKRQNQLAWGLGVLGLAMATGLSLSVTLILAQTWGWLVTLILLLATVGMGYYLYLRTLSLRGLEQAYHQLWQRLQQNHKASWVKLAELVFAFVTDLIGERLAKKIKGGQGD